MKRILAGMLAATLLAGSLPALAGPHGRGGHYYGPPAPRHHHHHHRGPGPVAWGLAGLALGTVIYAITAPPVVAAPAAPAIVVPPPQPGRTAYFCESYQAYYPNIQHCPEGWRAVPGY